MQERSAHAPCELSAHIAEHKLFWGNNNNKKKKQKEVEEEKKQEKEK